MPAAAAAAAAVVTEETQKKFRLNFETGSKGGEEELWRLRWRAFP